MSTATAALRQAVFEANQALVASGLVIETFGNVSGVDREAGLFVIKPSGVPYDRMTPADLVPVSLATGQVLEGDLRPSTDAPTHLELYRAFRCGGVAHTHSPYATAFAQGGRHLACMGTTHADYFRGDVPVTRPLTQAEVEGDYEAQTGRVIAETFRILRLSPFEVPGVLVAHHGPFTWGENAFAAVEHARILEHLARIESIRISVAPDALHPADYLVDRHYRRKHGADAYYGQP
ncbi:MAG TPA: L-ribulose-5-phosphate 4-epimerase AraD [Gemmatimonadales bacterium]|nr:L-ribulose-5-phosphate 4-epimerase AraD [Gemmatimonadales bacterium]